MYSKNRSPWASVTFFLISRYSRVRGHFHRSPSINSLPTAGWTTSVSTTKLFVHPTSHSAPPNSTNFTNPHHFKLPPPPLLNCTFNHRDSFSLTTFIITATNHDSANRQNEPFLRPWFQSLQPQPVQSQKRPAASSSNMAIHSNSLIKCQDV